MARGRIPYTRCTCRCPVALVHICGSRSTSRQAPSRSGCQRHQSPTTVQWCECRAHCHRMARANRSRKGCLFHREIESCQFVIVVGVLSVPAAVVRLERVVRPALTRVSSGYRDSLSIEAQRPDVGRVRVSNSRLNRLGRPACGGQRSCFNRRNGSGTTFWICRISFYPRDVRTASNVCTISRVPFTQDRIHDVE